MSAVLFWAPPLYATEAIIVAIPDVGFSDSSGEPTDQNTQHAERLSIVAAELRSNIQRRELVSSAAISCSALPCAATQLEIDLLREKARAGGASVIVLASVHKMSTLVLAMKVDAFEVASGRVVTSKLLSFRGDNDEGWRRAARFVARDVTDEILASSGSVAK